MADSIVKIQAKLMREYYKYFSKYSKGVQPKEKVAWVTAFTPVEILEALGILYYYPESYAAVIAASGKEQNLLQESESQHLSLDCCSYSCCIEGCLQLNEGPRGSLPKPDVLIATNNQCNTLPNWWNILAERYNVPLIVLDYPGESISTDAAYEYVTSQHRAFIQKMEELSGNTLDMNLLDKLLMNSSSSVCAWNKVIDQFKTHSVKPTLLFDGITHLITSRCKPETAELYGLLSKELGEKPAADLSTIPAFWLGYPLWYHPDRYLSEIMDGIRVVGANYITWWSLDYSGENAFEKLFHAYNFTFLNLSQETRNKKLGELITESGALGAITLHNKSCKCDFVSARDIKIPQVELEIDMIDRNYLNIDTAKERIALLKETICTN